MSETALINSLEMPVMDGNADFVPELDESYYFAKHAEHICQDIKSNKRVLLTGHTGCGKTSVIDQIAARIKQPVMRVNMNGQTTIGDFVGLYTLKGGQTEWVDGALPMCMRNGFWLIVDEVDYAEAAILSVLNPVLEKNGRLFLKEKGSEVIKPHPNFRIFATANSVGCMQKYRSLYQGTNAMNEAWLDRWNVYHIGYLSPKQEIEVLERKFPQLDAKMATDIVKVANQARKSFEDGLIQSTFSTRRLLDWTEMMLRYGDPIVGASMTIYAKVGEEDKYVIENLINHTLLGRSPVAQTSTGRAAQTAGAKPTVAKRPVAVR